MIHYISPFRSDKNIGKSINDAIEQVNPNDEDWIIHCDMDVCFLLPDTKSRIERILNTTDCQILGCMTNRLGLTYQLVTGMFNQDNIWSHIEMAKQIQSDEVVEVRHILAAFMLCFKVSVWKRFKFTENSIQFDSIFCAKAMNKGVKLGLMTGIYVLHLYRYQSVNPATDYLHLLR